MRALRKQKAESVKDVELERGAAERNEWVSGLRLGHASIACVGGWVRARRTNERGKKARNATLGLDWIGFAGAADGGRIDGGRRRAKGGGRTLEMEER